MANVVLLITNPTGTAYTNVNAAGDDIAAYSKGSIQTNANGTVTLTDAEVTTFTAAHPTALLQICTDATLTAAELEINRIAAKINKLGVFPGTYAP